MKDNPRNLEEGFEYLNDELRDGQIKLFKEMDEDEATTKCHHGLGQYLRNSLGLWSGSELKDFFIELGLWHADDMSDVILTSYHRHLNGHDINLEDQVNYYKKYWERKKSRKEEIA